MSCVSPTGCYKLTSQSDASFTIDVDDKVICNNLSPMSSVSFGYSALHGIEPNTCQDYIACNNRKISPYASERRLINSITRMSGKNIFYNKDSPQHKSLCWWLDDLDTNKDEEESQDKNTSLMQRYLLTLLYYSTNGDESWYNKSNWLQKESSECNWYGISCDAYDGVVSTINLASNNLVGYLPSEIGEFVELNHLILNDNNLKGALPVETVKLKALHTLKLSCNSFIGSIYSEIKYLTKLRDLDLSSNRFSSTLPSEIKFLDDLLLIVTLFYFYFLLLII